MFHEIITEFAPAFILKRIRRNRLKREISSNSFDTLRLFDNKAGIEIGGPSTIFESNGLLPIYDFIKKLDGVNFSTTTVWEGTLEKGENYKYNGGKKGYQFIAEASNLTEINDESYDFLLASHCLEHCANTLKTLYEWKRIIKRNGAILLILPDKQYTFDHRRDITSFDHLLNDYKLNVNETDMSHFDEIIKLHDLSRDSAAGNFEAFKERSKKNFENRCLHHHVFDIPLLLKIFEHVGIKPIFTASKNINQIIIGIKEQ